MSLDFSYYRNIILDPELDSSPLADFEAQGFEEKECTYEVSQKAMKSLETYCLQHDLSVLEVAKAACFILLEKYTNSVHSLVALSLQERLVPIFLSSEKNAHFLDYLKAFHTQLQESSEHEIPFQSLCEEFELRSLPILTDEKSFYDDLSLENYQDSDVKLAIYIHLEKGKLFFQSKYNQALYSKKTMDRLFHSYEAILEEIAQDKPISQMSALNDKLLSELDSFQRGEADYDENLTIVDRINEMVEKHGSHPAIIYKDQQISYTKLGDLSDRLAHYIGSLNLGKEDVVSILLLRSAYFPIASVGVLKAGAAYQPLDPSYPPERLQFMMEDANTKLLIADKELLSLVPEYKGAVLLVDELETLPESKEPLPNINKEDLFILLYTSGSTGVPKGVMLEHQNLIPFVEWYKNYYKLSFQSNVAAYASFGFDANMMDLYPTLTSGATLHIIPEEIRLDLLALNQYFIDHQITHSFMTTQIGRQYADLLSNSNYPHYLSVGGETLVPIEPPKYGLYNAYGPTECTVFVTHFPVDRLYRNVPIGKGLHNIRLYVVDKNGQRVATGAPGELWVAGPQVSRGYLNRPEQTQKVFIPNPFTSNKKYSRIYRTGDIVRFLEDGNIEFIGRKDSQVKIRGFRIELSEVEQVIRQFDGIQDVTVAAFDEVGGGKYIAAYVVSDQKVDIEALNEFILERKPPYMVPAVTMQIDRIPLNQNQKVNKRALPLPQRKALDMAKPENELQEKLYGVLKKVLGHSDFGIDTDFYMAGLTSIASMKFIVLLAQELNASISTKDLNENPTIRQLENFLSSQPKDVEMEKRDQYPLTQTQMGIYVECLKDPTATFYNLPGYFALGPQTDIEKLCQSIEKVIDAHPAIKCTIVTKEDGIPYMIPQDDRQVNVEILQGSEEEFERFFATFAKPFDFETGPLYRLAIFKTDKHVYLVVDFHHIMSDGTSIALFAEELDRVLKGQEPLGERYTQFDLALREEKALASDEYAKAKAYYDATFGEVSHDTLPDPDVYDQKQEQCGFFREYNDQLSYEAVEKFCKKHKITPNVFFLAVLGFVLGQYAHEEQACFTTIYNGRNDGLKASMMGMLVKTLPVLCNLAENTPLPEYLQAVQKQLLSSMRNDIYSFAEVSRAYHINADVLFAYQGDDFVEFDLDGQKTIFREGVSDKAKAKLSIDVFVEKGIYRFEFEYRKDLFSKAFIERFLDIFVQSANSFLKAKTLGEVNITSPKQATIIEEFNQTDYPVKMQSVDKIFEDVVKHNPNKTAIIASGESLTYDELNRLANRLAHGLLKLYDRAQGLAPDTIVGFILDRTKEVYIVEHGILKAGGAFLPMTPEYPNDRIDYCLQDANCAYVITTQKIKEDRQELWKDKPYQVVTVEELLEKTTNKEEENLEIEIPVESLAYCIYTSGSTGKPKGVMIEHRNLCNYVNFNERNYESKDFIDGADTILALAAISFDLSILENFVPICNGKTICMASEEEIYNPLALANLIQKHHVQSLAATPSYLANIIEIEQVKEALAGVKIFDLGAEAFPSSLYTQIKEINPEARIINGYGPTECTVSCTSINLTSPEHITIGKPAANVKTYILDKNNHILPIGISGELVICGAGVGRGYRNLPEKTKEAFFEFGGLKAYHSGDLARWTPEGTIDFLGRLDNQVKLRGLRVELDEIETVLNSFPTVKMSKVIVCNNGKEDYLAGYFTASDSVDLGALTEYMKSKLAHYMVPSALMQLDEMPLTVNGKIDKKRLPSIQMETKREYVEPTSDLEKEFADLFAEILHLEQVGATDNFFEIGGTSLSATKIATYALTKGYSLVYKDVFANPTPAQLAQFIEEQTLSQDKWEIQSYDYTAIDDLLAKNSLALINHIQKGSLKNILLTGATGFLGIHVLREFLLTCSGIAYCLVRKGSYASPEKRLMNMLMYYFGEPFEEFFKERIVCIDGDITDKERVMSLAQYDFTTVINCAACVKHFVSDDSLDRVNVEGVKNLIDLCKKTGRRLIQISTTSVAGEGNDLTVPSDKVIQEDELYFGQIIDNDYIRTKFLAERLILEACAKGKLEGKIIRVGNLMSRKSDGEFQINFVTNGFMRTLNAYRTLGQFPIGLMHAPAEFSPIDSTAAAIISLAKAQSPFTVFHAYNSHKIFMSDVIYAMKQYGFDIEVVSNERFDETLKEAAKNPDQSDAVLGLIAYASGDAHPRYELMADNRFTVEALYRLDYKWPITDDLYLENAIRALDTLGYFE